MGIPFSEKSVPHCLVKQVGAGSSTRAGGHGYVCRAMT